MVNYLKFATDASSSVAVTEATAVNLDAALAGDANIDRIRDADLFEIQPDADIRVFWNGNIPTASLGMLVSAKEIATITGANVKAINVIKATAGAANVIVIPGASVKGFDS